MSSVCIPRTATLLPCRIPTDVGIQASLTLPYTGGVAAAPAGDSSTDLDDYFTASLEMQSDRAPRTLPPGHLSRARNPPHLAAAFSGVSSFSSSQHYVLTGDSQSGSQNSLTGNRQSIDLSGELSRSNLHRRLERPWNHLEATDHPSNVALDHSKLTDSTGLPRTPDINIDPFTDFRNSDFHDSALGTGTQDERQSLLSSSMDDMDSYWNLPPQEVQPQDQDDGPDEPDEPHDVGETESEAGQEGAQQLRPKPKNPRQARSKEELTCTVCGLVSKTPSDSKYDCHLLSAWETTNVGQKAPSTT